MKFAIPVWYNNWLKIGIPDVKTAFMIDVIYRMYSVIASSFMMYDDGLFFDGGNKR